LISHISPLPGMKDGEGPLPLSGLLPNKPDAFQSWICRQDFHPKAAGPASLLARRLFCFNVR